MIEIAQLANLLAGKEHVIDPNDESYLIDLRSGRRLRRVRGADEWPLPNPPAARTTGSANNSVPNQSSRVLDLGGEDYDTNGMFNPATTALTGTVSTTASGTTLTGSGTAFLTELSIGDAIFVGSAAGEDVNVITDIASNTSATVKKGWYNTASGQTFRRASEAIVVKRPGIYVVSAYLQLGTTTGNTYLFNINKNGTTIGRFSGSAAYTEAGIGSGGFVIAQAKAALYDFFWVEARQNTGGTITMNCSLSATWLGSG